MDAETTGPVSKEDAYDVSDPTDWLGTPLRSLIPVEQALRCHVCKDFYNSPMVTSCCHTFCSLCIRRALAIDGKCPLCRATDQVSRLRGNWAIREAVESFSKGRDALLRLARELLAPPATDVPTQTPKRKAVDETKDGNHWSKRTRMSTRSASVRSAENKSAMTRQDADPEVQELEVEECTPVIDDGLVSCPICSWRMKPEKVDRHLDTDCPGEPRPQPSESKSRTFGFTNRPAVNIPRKAQERLSSLNYSLIKESALRKKLSEIGISSWGSRQLLEKRHKEWVMIWNANCDSARPKSKSDLLRDLDTWERTQGGNASLTSHSANLGAQIKDKEFDGVGWSAKHSDSFKDLIANARKTRQNAEATTRQPSHENRNRSPFTPSNAIPSQRPVSIANGSDLAENYPIRSSETMMGIPASQIGAGQSPPRLPEGIDGPLEQDDQPLHSELDSVASSGYVGTKDP